MTSKITLELKQETLESLTALLSSGTLGEYCEEVLERHANDKVKLVDGYVWSTAERKLFDANGVDMKLTPIQTEIMCILVGTDGIVETDTLIEKTGMANSIFTLRNMIKQIRDKSVYSLIKNHSGRGYSVGRG